VAYHGATRVLIRSSADSPRRCGAGTRCIVQAPLGAAGGVPAHASRQHRRRFCEVSHEQLSVGLFVQGKLPRRRQRAAKERRGAGVFVDTAERVRQQGQRKRKFGPVGRACELRVEREERGVAAEGGGAAAG
jgi:hypothetical protein